MRDGSETELENLLNLIAENLLEIACEIYLFFV